MASRTCSGALPGRGFAGGALRSRALAVMHLWEFQQWQLADAGRKEKLSVSAPGSLHPLSLAWSKIKQKVK